MPFTISHPAAAVPFSRLGLPLSALIVGSMSPDFVFFLRLMPPPRGHFSHTIPALFLFCLPAGLLVLWCFHALLKWPLLSLAPYQLQTRLIGPATGFTYWPLSRLVLIVSSILLGAGGHLIWDDITHGDGRTVALFTVLRLPVMEWESSTLAVYHVLQYVSTLAGGGTPPVLGR